MAVTVRRGQLGTISRLIVNRLAAGGTVLIGEPLCLFVYVTNTNDITGTEAQWSKHWHEPVQFITKRNIC